MKPSGGFCPSRANLRMRVPDIKSKSSWLREEEEEGGGERERRKGEKKKKTRTYFKSRQSCSYSSAFLILYKFFLGSINAL